jgi:ElaB/YqjD/DUF883 family membrane-anchored ribosome-binding protein
MSTMKDEFQGIKDEARDKLSADLAELRASFGKLRSDVMTLLHDAMGVGKTAGRTSADVAKDQASAAYDTVKGKVEDLKDRGTEQMEVLSHKIEQNPMTSALIALGVGFLVAKILTRK